MGINPIRKINIDCCNNNEIKNKKREIEIKKREKSEKREKTKKVDKKVDKK
jgi:hypothetical protein